MGITHLDELTNGYFPIWTPVSAAAPVVSRGEDHLREPAAEGLVVAELLEQLGVVCQQLGHGACEGLVVLDTRVLLVGVGHGVLVGPVIGDLRGKILGNHPLDLVLVLPLDVAEPVVELPDDVGETVELRFWLLSNALWRHRLDLCVLIGKLDVLDRLLLHPVAVHVDGFENPLRQVVLHGRGQLGHEEGQED